MLGFSLAAAAWLEHSSKQQAVFKKSTKSAATVTLAAATQLTYHQRCTPTIVSLDGS